MLGMLGALRRRCICLKKAAKMNEIVPKMTVIWLDMVGTWSESDEKHWFCDVLVRGKKGHDGACLALGP